MFQKMALNLSSGEKIALRMTLKLYPIKAFIHSQNSADIVHHMQTYPTLNHSLHPLLLNIGYTMHIHIQHQIFECAIFHVYTSLCIDSHFLHPDYERKV